MKLQQSLADLLISISLLLHFSLALWPAAANSWQHKQKNLNSRILHSSFSRSNKSLGPLDQPLTSLKSKRESYGCSWILTIQNYSTLHDCNNLLCGTRSVQSREQQASNKETAKNLKSCGAFGRHT
jgi:hypothetical protein